MVLQRSHVKALEDNNSTLKDELLRETVSASEANKLLAKEKEAWQINIGMVEVLKKSVS